MHILVAPNAFKNSLDASKVAEAISQGLYKSKLNCLCECFPVGDGGDGTGNLIEKKLSGTSEKTWVQNSMGRPIKASFSLIESGKTAVIEMANASGLRLLNPHNLNPLLASSIGTGQQIKAALDKGVNKIIIAMGGSSTVDGGTGILKALGVRFLNAGGNELTSTMDDFCHLTSIDLSGLDGRIKKCRLIVLCDVENRLLGKQGCANIFGPQKGASPSQVRVLDTALTKLAKIVLDQTGKDMSTVKYGGTAGGAAAGLFALLNAELVNGIDYFLQLTDFDSALKRNTLVITAEGSIDAQTLKGKAPFGVACRAKSKGIPVIALAGNVPLKENVHLKKYFDAIIPIGHKPLDLTAALAVTSQNIIRTSTLIGNLLVIAHSGF